MKINRHKQPEGLTFQTFYDSLKDVLSDAAIREQWVNLQRSLKIKKIKKYTLKPAAQVFGILFLIAFGFVLGSGYINMQDSCRICEKRAYESIVKTDPKYYRAMAIGGTMVRSMNQFCRSMVKSQMYNNERVKELEENETDIDIILDGVGGE